MRPTTSGSGLFSAVNARKKLKTTVSSLVNKRSDDTNSCDRETTGCGGGYGGLEEGTHAREQLGGGQEGSGGGH
jgi:hypothetical protein